MNYYTERGQELRAERGHEFYAQWAARIRGGLPKEREQEVLKLWKNRDNG